MILITLPETSSHNYITFPYSPGSGRHSTTREVLACDPPLPSKGIQPHFVFSIALYPYFYSESMHKEHQKILASKFWVRFWHQNSGSGDLTHVLFIVVFLRRCRLLIGTPNFLLQAGEFPLGLFYELDFWGNICF